MLKQQDLSRPELELWNQVVGETTRPFTDDSADGAQDDGRGEREQIRADVIIQLATDPATGSTSGNAMVSVTYKEIVGNLTLEAAQLKLPLILDDCVIGEINLDQAQAPGIVITKSDVQLLTAHQLHTGNVILDGTTVAREVGLVDAHLSGVFSLREAHFTDPVLALDAHNIQVDGDVLAADFRAAGQVDLSGARIGGSLELVRSALTSSPGPALTGNSMSVEKDLLGQELKAVGGIELRGAHIRGDLYLDKARIDGIGNEDRHALSGQLLDVGRDMSCQNMKVDGQLRLAGANIHARLDLRGTQVVNGVEKAFFARGLRVSEDLRCSEGFTVLGETDLSSAEIGRELNFQGAAFHGLVSLDSATTHRLVDKDTKGFDELVLRDFTYASFEGIGDPTSVEYRLNWLKRNRGGYQPQIYNKLAEAYRADGQDAASRTVLIAKLHEKSHERKGFFRYLGMLFDLFLEYTIGYGYKPSRIVWWAAGMLVIGWISFANFQAHHYVMVKSGALGSGFDSRWYTLDLLLPVAGIGQRQGVIPVGPAIPINIYFILLGWLFGLILVAGLSGVFKRD